MRNKKQAVCISGQARNFAQPLREMRSLFSPAESSFFISVWRKRGRKLGGPLEGWQLRRMLSDRIVDQLPLHLMGEYLYKKIPQFRDYLALLDTNAGDVRAEEFLDILPEAVVDIEDDDDFEWQFEPDPSRVAQNGHRMFYKMLRANRMRVECEVRKHVRHDAVVRTRPDMLILELDPEKTLATPKTFGCIWERTFGQETGVDDTLGVLRPGDADALSDMRATLGRYWPYGSERWTSAHTILNQRATEIGLRPVQIQGRAWLHSERISDDEFLTCLNGALDVAEMPIKNELLSLRECILTSGILPDAPEIALKRLRIAIDLDPNSFAPHLQAGLALYRLGNREEALREWKLSLELARYESHFGFAIERVRALSSEAAAELTACHILV